MVALQRNQLVRLTDLGWQAVLGQSWAQADRECLTHWATHRLPLVVTQQPQGLSDAHIGVGLPAPRQWQRRRMALGVPVSHVLPCDEFPQAPAVAGMVAPSVRSELLRLFRALEGLGATPRVYGSFGWQLLTGLEYVSATSDLDLLVSASNPSNADDIARAMSAAQPGRLRLDGELRFPSGAAVAWREWLQWRARTVDRVLVKRLDGVAMVQDGACFEEACAEQGASGR